VIVLIPWIALAVLAMTIALVALLVRALRSLDRDAEPDWWPEFERELADYVERRSGRPPVD
jgi:hypothetical protein